MYWDIELDDQLLQDLYGWIDQIPLSRPKKRIDKDFADGVMVAELIKHYFPSWIDLHNYAAANSTEQKLINWGLLNRKVLSRLDLNVPEHIMRGICLGRSGLVEIFLCNLRTKIDEHFSGEQPKTSAPPQRAVRQEAKANGMGDAGAMPQHQRHSSPQRQDQYSSGYSRNESKPMVQGGYPTKKTPAMPNLSTDMVSRIHYDEKEQECLAKDQQIQILQAKIRRLEHLLHLKDVRVDDLADRLDQTKGISGGRPNQQQPTQMSMNGRK